MGGSIFSKTADTREKWNDAVELEESSLANSLNALDMAANPDIARYKLQLRENGDESVDSPYYVNYPSAQGTIKCRVLYNDNTYGLQLVSVDAVTTLSLGHEDENIHVEGETGSVERAQSSYNRAILTLNEKAEEYLPTLNGSVLATDARCLGSNPLNKNYPDNLTGDERQAAMIATDAAFMSEYTGKYFNIDSNYESDFNRLKAIGAEKLENPNDGEYGQFYHLASRDIHCNSSSYAFYLRAAKRTKLI